MQVNSSGRKVTFDKLQDGVDEGHAIANVFDVVMDEAFIKQSRHNWCWLSWKEVPTETGWYKVDREKNQLPKIDEEEAKKLEWYERLFVYGSGHAAVSENLPLALYIGDEYTDSRLSGLYLCGPDVLTWVAQKPI
ncbi:MAG: hypothetical protein EXS50_02625 [Candidatus Taylorbacteria bacterium]|nr:hypothetical protein [Candidatus Taylorbacteria bacterium]